MLSIAFRSSNLYLNFIQMLGEMSSTIIYNPKAWQTQASNIKSLMSPIPVSIGIAFNSNKLCFCFNDFKAVTHDNWEMVTEFAGNFSRIEKTEKFDRAGLQALFSTIDFFGTSYYPPLNEGFQLKDMEVNLEIFDRELSLFGIGSVPLALSTTLLSPLSNYQKQPVDMKQQIASGKKFFFKEWGLGGGTFKGNGGLAESAQDAANNPYYHVNLPYTKDNNPWGKPDVKAYRDFWLDQSLKYLGQGGIKYKISGAFVWNLVSFDFQGVTQGKDEFVYSPDLTAKVSAFNIAQISGKV